jgi:hypothetical protein
MMKVFIFFISLIFRMAFLVCAYQLDFSLPSIFLGNVLFAGIDGYMLNLVLKKSFGLILILTCLNVFIPIVGHIVCMLLEGSKQEEVEEEIIAIDVSHPSNSVMANNESVIGKWNSEWGRKALLKEFVASSTPRSDQILDKLRKSEDYFIKCSTHSAQLLIEDELWKTLKNKVDKHSDIESLLGQAYLDPQIKDFLLKEYS